MLVVPVDLDGDVESVAQCIAIAHLDRATDAEVHGQGDDRSPPPAALEPPYRRRSRR